MAPGSATAGGATIRSTLTGIPWPAVPGPAAAMLLSFQHELASTQWLAPEELRQRQFGALDTLLRHACATVPYYRERPAYTAAFGATGSGPLHPEAWAALPILRREDVQAAGPSLLSDAIPPDHLPLGTLTTSGSTGRPLSMTITRVTNAFWHGITLREHLWHGRDPSLMAATLRTDGAGAVPPDGLVHRRWGPPIDTVYDTGPLAMMSVQQDVARQADFVAAHDPAYLLSLPSNLLALSRRFAETGMKLPNLREARTYGEVLSPAVREACREVWDVPVTDMYSTQELGYLALQCPSGERYHVMSEVVLLEVLDDDGRPCEPGGTGRVVVTHLHNYAMPLVRYEVGDFAEVGAPCPCGRGLPTLDRVVGRQRNMLTLPTGERFWPTFGSAWRPLRDVVRQFQLVQQEPDLIHARIVGPRPLTLEEQATVAAELRQRFGYPFRVTFEFLARIDRTAGAKFEDFVSLVEPAG